MRRSPAALERNQRQGFLSQTNLEKAAEQPTQLDLSVQFRRHSGHGGIKTTEGEFWSLI